MSVGLLQGNGFFLGLALWPGGSVDEWGAVYNTTTVEFGLNPCNTTGNFLTTGLTPAKYLASKGVVFAAFELQVDALVALAINYTDLLPLVKASVNANAPFISAIAFRGPYRSEAVYIYSNVTALTHAAGFVPTLSLVAQFSRGNLTRLQWSDLSCDACGGTLSSQCMTSHQPQPQRSCTAPAAACGNGTDCSLSVFGAFSGSDRSGVSFTSSLQLSNINQFALSTYFYDGTAQLHKLLQGIQSTGEVGGGSSGASSSGSAA